MLFSVEQAFVGRDEKQAPLKTPAWEASYGEVLRKKTKQDLQFSMNLGRVFVFYNPPPPKWNEEPLQSHLKKAGKSYHDLKCMSKKQQELQLSTNFAIIVSTRGRELLRLFTIVTWGLIQVESTLFTLMRNSVLCQEIYLVRITSILNFHLITLCRFSFWTNSRQRG